ncbi:flagellar protein FlaG [Modicisalibacter tunisiensis]|uniref:Flagellar protein FlaG n=2 Tax=Halomonadaceae TaxID=28256 RepID=A0ABS7X079_9GAMM|nr:flagellar protein FlaG [Modicisalibacter tunisiensis]MBZ9568287.1 flagellar protein FlaG [Modicisalibacter tunisiensis]
MSPVTDATPQQRLERLLANLTPPPGDSPDEANQASAATRSDLAEPLQRVNAAMKNYGIEFDLHSHDGRIVTRVIDRESGELIRQIPSEELLRVAASLSDMQGRLIHIEA